MVSYVIEYWLVWRFSLCVCLFLFIFKSLLFYFLFFLPPLFRFDMFEELYNSFNQLCFLDIGADIINILVTSDEVCQ